MDMTLASGEVITGIPDNWTQKDVVDKLTANDYTMREIYGDRGETPYGIPLYNANGKLKDWNDITNDMFYNKLGNGEKVDYQKRYIEQGGNVPASAQFKNAAQAVEAIGENAWMNTANWFHKDDGKKFYSENEINRESLQDPLARGLGQAAVATAAWESAAAAIPEITVGEGVSLGSRAATKVLNTTTKAVAGSMASQVATEGEITPEQTAKDLAFAHGAEAVTHGVPMLWRASPTRIAKQMEAYVSGNEAAYRELEMAKRAHAANQGNTFEKVFKHEYELNPNVTVAEVFEKWGQVAPEMTELRNGNTVSPIDQVAEELFGSELPEHATKQEVKSNVSSAQALRNGQSFSEMAMNGETGSRSVIDALDESAKDRKWYQLSPNLGVLPEETLRELGLDGKFFRTAQTVGSIGEKTMFGIPAVLRKSAVSATVKRTIDNLQEAVVNEMEFINNRLEELKAGKNGLSGNAAIVQDARITAFGKQAEHNMQILKQLDRLKKGLKVDVDSLINKFKLAQDDKFAGEELLNEAGNGFGGLSARTRDVARELNALNLMLKSSGASLYDVIGTSAHLLHLGIMDTITIPAVILKEIESRKAIRDVGIARNIAENVEGERLDEIRLHGQHKNELEQSKSRFPENKAETNIVIKNLEDRIEELSDRESIFLKAAREEVREMYEKADRNLSELARNIRQGAIITNRLNKED